MSFFAPTSRTVFTFLLLPLILSAVWIGGAFYFCLVSLIMLLGFWEWSDIVLSEKEGKLGIKIAAALSLPLLFFLGVVAFSHAEEWGVIIKVAAAFGCIIIFSVITVSFFFMTKNKPQNSRAFFGLFLGLSYIFLSGLSLLVLRLCPIHLEEERFNGFDSKTQIFYLLFVFLGTKFGARATEIIEKKAFGSRAHPSMWTKLASIVIASGMGVFISVLGGGTSPIIAASAAVALSIASYGGDFLNPFIKKNFKPKDAENFISEDAGKAVLSAHSHFLKAIISLGVAAISVMGLRYHDFYFLFLAIVLFAVFSMAFHAGAFFTYVFNSKTPIKDKSPLFSWYGKILAQINGLCCAAIFMLFIVAGTILNRGFYL